MNMCVSVCESFICVRDVSECGYEYMSMCVSACMQMS